MLVLAVAIAMGLARQRLLAIPAAVVVGAAAVGVNLAITVWAGGDWMSHRRHLVAILPLLVLVATWTAAASGGVWRRNPRVGALVLGGVACVLTVTALGFEPWRVAGERGREPDYLARIGRSTAATPGTALLTNGAGVLPYRAGPGTYTSDRSG